MCTSSEGTHNSDRRSSRNAASRPKTPQTAGRTNSSRPTSRAESRLLFGPEKGLDADAGSPKKYSSVSEVRRVAEELKVKSGSKGIDFLVTTQGQSLLPAASRTFPTVQRGLEREDSSSRLHACRRSSERQIHRNVHQAIARLSFRRTDPLPLRSRVPTRLVRNPQGHVGVGVRPRGRERSRTGRRESRVARRRAPGQVDARTGAGTGETGFGARGCYCRRESDTSFSVVFRSGFRGAQEIAAFTRLRSGLSPSRHS